MFIKRLFSSVVWILFSYAVIYLFPFWVFRIVVTVLVGLGLFEFYSLAEKKGFRVGKYFATSIGVLVPLLAYREHLSPKMLAAYPFFSLLFFLVFFVYQFAKGKNEGSLAGLSLAITGIAYVSLLFSFLIPLRMEGAHWVVYLLGVTKGGDIGAYLVGSAFGKQPLVPRVSPHKTIEGMVGGIVTSTLIGLLIFQILFRDHFLFLENRAASWFLFGGLSLALGIVGLLGDLTESLIKRDCQTKDTRKFIPGMGGILDVIDSLLFTTPLLCAFVRFIQ